MNHLEEKGNQPDGELMVVVSYSLLQSINKKQDEILSHLKADNSHPTALKDYLTEVEAKKLLKKKTTWFWSMRTSGKLAFVKVGRTNYYKVTEIQNLFNTDSK